jgi:tetratricopeptide (TPR) repeat protein
MNLEKVCAAIIRWGFYLLAVIVPLVLTPWNYELFEFNKMIAVYTLTAVIVSAWLVRMFDRKKLTIARTPLDIPIGLFFASQLVSAVFSIDPHISWLGYYSRFNGGVWSLVCYILLYYAFVSNYITTVKIPSNESRITNNESRKKSKFNLPTPVIPDSGSMIRRLLSVFLATGSIVAIYGFLERLGIDKNLWVQDVQTRVFSTLGQPNWLAAYLVALIPLSMAYVINRISYRKAENGKQITENKDILAEFFRHPSSVISLFITLLFFFVLLCTRSRSGLLGLAVAEVIFWSAVILNSREKIRILIPFGLIHGVFFLVIFFNGSYIPQIDKYLTLSAWSARMAPKSVTQNAPVEAATPKPSGTLLEYGGTESGTIRKYVWEAAINAWKATPKNLMIGTGTETFAWTFFQYRPDGHNLVSEWDFLYNKAHNEYLNYLATTGLFGLGSYLTFIFLFIITFLKYQISNIKYQINFKYKNLKNNPQINSFNQISSDNEAIQLFNNLLIIAMFAGWISILVTNFFGFSVVIIQLFMFLFPAMVLVLANEDLPFTEIALPSWTSGIGKIIFTLAGFTMVIIVFLYWYADTLYAKGYRLSRSGLAAQAQPLLEDAISINPGEPNYHDELANVLSAITYQTLENKDTTGAQDSAKKSISENELALKISPNNVNFWKTRTKILYALSTYDPKFNTMAIEALTRALSLSPNDPKIIYNLGILYGRENNPEKAIALMEKSKAVKPNYRDAYYGLYVMYNEAGDDKKAKAELIEYLTKVDPNDQEFKTRLAQ